jgi:hypothetical protein
MRVARRTRSIEWLQSEFDDGKSTSSDALVVDDTRGQRAVTATSPLDELATVDEQRATSDVPLMA